MRTGFQLHIKVWGAILLLGLGLFNSTSQAQDSPPTIIFWHHYADEARADFWAEMASEFNAAHAEVAGVEVRYYAAYHNQQAAILSSLVNGSLPDVALIRNYDAALYQLGGALVDLTSFLENDPNLSAGDFYPQILASDQQGEMQLGLPLSRSAEALYVNLDGLQALGYDAPPQTRAEWGAMACAFREAGGWDAVSGQGSSSTAFEIRLDAAFILALSQPMSIFDAELGLFDFDQEGLRDTLAFLQEMLAGGCGSLNPAQAPNVAQNAFAGGQSLFYIDSSAAYPYVESAIGDYFAQPFNWTLVPIPAHEQPISNLYGASLSIFASNPEQEAAAWAWVAWLAEAERVAAWAALNQALPARLDVPPPPQLRAFLPENGALWYLEPQIGGYDLIRDELIFTVRAILGGEPVEKLSELNEIAHEIYAAFAPVIE